MGVDVCDVFRWRSSTAGVIWVTLGHPGSLWVTCQHLRPGHWAFWGDPRGGLLATELRPKGLRVHFSEWVALWVVLATPASIADAVQASRI